MNIEKYHEILAKIKPYQATLVAVSKTKPASDVEDLHKAGQLVFGENKVQEMCGKFDELPKTIQWHMIGHLQRNKVKYMAPFVSLIHGVDSLKLLKEINKQAAKNDRVQDCLLQMFIATEETKFGFAESEVLEMLDSEEFATLANIRVKGVMGMASNTDNVDQVKREFSSLRRFFDQLSAHQFSGDEAFSEISMGMSGDYELALDQGSTMIRVGSLIFGERNYVK